LPVKPVEKPIENKLMLNVKAEMSSWLRIVADDVMVYEEILSSGTEKKFEAQNNFRLIIGYAPGLKVSLNGKEINVISGAKKDVNDIRLSRENLR
jgi:hypothetical protein